MVDKCRQCVGEAPTRKLGLELASDATYVSFCKSGNYWWREPLCDHHVHLGMIAGVKTIRIEDEQGDELEALKGPSHD